jgi:hypothetical protein
MKTIRLVAVGFCVVFALSSCGVASKLFPSKYGCKSDGKNVGAEKLLDGSKVPKAKKFKA